MTRRYILQGASMNAKVLSIISAPGYPTVIKGKMPIIMDMDDDGSWRTSIPILHGVILMYTLMLEWAVHLLQLWMHTY